MADATCSVDGCDRTSRARGMCRMHWERWKKDGDAGSAGRLRREKAPGSRCAIDGCSNAIQARGLCSKHYQQDRAVRNGSAQCRRRGCTLLAVLDGLCMPHYTRRRRMDDEQELRDARRCSVENCDRPEDAAGYCTMHYQRVKKHGDPGPAGRMRAENGTGYIDRNGYVVRWRNGKRNVFEHREVMESILGRPLVDGENVHHKNGKRSDNRPGNLELWLVVQPAGQRVTDLMAYIAEYHAEAMAQMLAERR